jgi:hypothetical protein
VNLCNRSLRHAHRPPAPSSFSAGLSLLSFLAREPNVNFEKGGQHETLHRQRQRSGRSIAPKQDIYARITAKIVAALEDGVRPWVRPWNAEHAAGRITRPLRHNGQPYTGINILSLWASASVQGFAAPIWMTYRQAVGLSRPRPQGRERLARRLREQHHAQ